MSWASLFVALWAAPAKADTPALRLIPTEVELVAALPQPAKVLNIALNHPVTKELLKSELVGALYDNTTLRRFDQVVAFFEKKLEHKREALFEELTSGGAVLGARLSEKPAAIGIIQARDEKLLASFLAEAIDVVDQELERQESKDRVRKSMHAKVATSHFGKGLHVAQLGSFLAIASDEGLLHKAIELHQQDGAVPKGSVLERLPAKKRGDNVLAWTWIDFEGVQRSKEFAEGLKAATTDPFLQLFAGGFLDVLKRTPYLDFELTEEGKDFRLRFSMAKGVKGMSDLAKSFITTTEKKLLPPLNPPRVISSTTWTFDLGELWKNKLAWLGEQGDKDLATAEKTIKPFLGGVGLGELLEGAGWNQRIVLAEAATSPYKIKPATAITPFGIVFETKDDKFAPAMEKILRTGGLLATFQFALKMRDEEHKGQKIVTYYFDEARKRDDDPMNIRFSFSPSFVQVGRSYVISSTVELARDLVDCLLEEEKAALTGKSARMAAGASWRTDLFAAGLAANLKSVRQDLLAAAILDQGLPPAEAGKQLDALIDLVRTLGVVHWDIRYGEDDYRMEFLWKYGGK